MQLKLAPHNAPWQWKVIQGEVAKRHIATFFLHYISESEFTATVNDRAYVSVEEAADKGREEEPNMRQLTLLLYPADGEEPEEEIVQTDIRPGEGAWKI